MSRMLRRDYQSFGWGDVVPTRKQRLMQVFTIHEHKNGVTNMLGAYSSFVGPYQLLYMMGVRLACCVKDMDRSEIPTWIWYGGDRVSYLIEKWDVAQ